MRKIKFRIWNNRFNDWQILDFGDSLLDGGLATANFDWKKLGQYTGLLDKNGKEIYSGDVIEWKSGEFQSKGKVIYNEIFACFTIIDEITDWGRGKYEIIGNIYEGLHSGEKLDILDKWKKNTNKQSQKLLKDTKLVKKPKEKLD